MSSESWSELAIAVVALVIVAVAATVVAVAALVGRPRVRQAGEQQGRQRTVRTLLDPERSLTAALLLVQAIALATAASLLTTVVLRELDIAEHVIAVIVVALVFLVFGQAFPRAYAATHPERAAGAMVAIASALVVLVRPLTALGNGLTALWGKLLAPNPAYPDLVAGEDELRAVIAGQDDGVVEPDEREMIDAVLHLEDTPVRDIMVPRVDIVAVEENQSPADILAVITGAGHSRVPVYRETIDRIVGVLYAKDLLPFVIGNTVQIPLSRLLRRAYVVPESKRIDDLLAELRRNRVHIAIVADEYGGTAGLVTIEDIIEEIVGDIQDEYDAEAPLLEMIGLGEIVVDGGIPLDEVEDVLGVDLRDEEEDITTAAGFVHHHLERLPIVGDRFETDGVLVEVESMEGRRLRRLRLLRLDRSPSDATAADPTTAPQPQLPALPPPPA
ncbi:MAG: HlyC/CorC family transporter [Thermomicrobiales bacterium]|nr:HlyC/CorC family transporter [Thermomicrobiales bacterium]